MSETTTPAAADEAPAQPAGPSDRDKRIDELAKSIYDDLLKENLTKLPTERAKPEKLWDQARKRARGQVRADERRDKVKAAVRSAAMSFYADGKAACTRNRKQLAPWLLTVPYAMTGEAVYLLAEHGSGSPIGIAGTTGTAAIAGSWLWWRKKIGAATPAPFAQRMKTALGLLCAWTAGMPVTAASGAGQTGMWLALVSGAAFMGLPWWREHDHPIPLPPGLPALAGADELGAREPTEEELGFANQVIADWDEHVTGKGTLPGSTLTNPQRIQYGWTFQLNLVRGKQKIADVRNAKPTIVAALHQDNITIDKGVNHSTVVLTFITEQVSNLYDGPRIVRENGDVFIEIGPYEDGIGCERFHALAGQLTDEELAAGEKPRGSMNGGFALGTKGSGKSRLIEAIADGLRELGIEIWYLDPQCGKSSPALDAEADWPFSGVHGRKGAYSNIVDLWKAMKATTELRAAESAGDQGFQHTRERPAIMAIIDECHGVFSATNPETGNSFGADFADLDREMRKNGLGLFGASQGITQDTFGRGNKAAILRDGMCAVNVYLLSYGGKNLTLAPGYDGQPCGLLPTNRGYGYNPKGARPHMRFQARYTPDFHRWLAAKPKSTLDLRAQKRIGDAYLKRFEKHSEDKAALKAWLAALDAHEGDASAMPGPGQELAAAKGSSDGGGSAKLLSLMSPAQKRLMAAGRAAAPAAPVLQPRKEEPALPPEPVESSEPEDVRLTDAEQHIVGILRDASQSPTTLAAVLNISSQGAGKHLRRLAEKGAALKMEDGRYMAR